MDRYALYSKYFFNKSVGTQVSIGGDTNTDINQYYGFLLYNVLRAKLPVGVQVGIGPYLTRTSLGNAGYTLGVATASERP